MFCTKCGSELREGVKFCTSCGAAVEAPTLVVEETPVVESAPVVEEISVVEEAPVVEPTPVVPQTPAPKKSNKGPVIAVLGVVAALLIAMAVCLWMIFGATVSVGEAFANTLNRVTADVEKMQEEIPGTQFFMDYFDEQYTVKTTYEDTSMNVEVVIESDIANGQMKISPSALGMGGDLYLSNNDIVVDASAILGKAYGVQTQTLGKDYNESAFPSLLGLEQLPEDFGFELFELLKLCDAKDAAEAFKDISMKNTLSIFGELETEKLGKETITINGETVKTQAYRIEMPTPEVFETYAKGMLEDILEDEAFAPYLEENEIIALLENLTGETLPQEIPAALEEVVDDMVAEYEYSYESEFNDFYFTGYVYKKQMVRLSLQCESDDAVVYVDVNPVGNSLEYMAFFGFEDENDSDPMYIAELEMVYEDEVLTYDAYLEEYGETVMQYEIEFDTKETKNNFRMDVEAEYSEPISEVMTIDVTNDDVIYIEYAIDELDATLEMEMKKGALEDGWFEFPADYTNVFDMSEDEIYSMILMAYSI